MTPEEREQVTAAIEAGQAIVCYSKCYSCMFGCCYETPTWHTWADPEDIEHARETGQPDPSESRCGCPCANAPRDLGGGL